MKKMHAVLLVFLFLLHICCVCVQAKQENVLKNSDFEENVSGWNARNGAKISWSAGGSHGSKGCAKVSKGSYNYYSITQTVKLQKGETYNISFDFRVESGNKNLMVIAYFDKGYKYLLQNESIGNKWKELNLIYVHDGKNRDGEDVDGTVSFEFRINDGQQAVTYYLDNFEIVPHGDVAPIDAATDETEIFHDPLPERRELRQMSFGDVKGHWSESTVRALYANHIIDGLSDTEFMPDKTLTRAEFVTALIKSLHLKETSYRNSYGDISVSDWYSGAVQTAADSGLIPTYFTKDKNFYPNRELTREEACMILSAYLQAKGISVSAEPMSFSDGDRVLTEAKGAVQTVIASGVIAGYDDGKLRPKAVITRAEMAEILMRLVELERKIAIYVDCDKGSDQNAGTAVAPYATVEKAAETLKNYTQDMREHLFVFVRGTETVRTPIRLKNAHSGSNGYQVVFTSWGEDKPVISGGYEVKGFTPYQNGIYRAKVPSGLQSRHFYVNGLRGVRARSNGGLTDSSIDNEGHTTTDTFLSSYKKLSDLEFVYKINWTHSRCGVASVTDNKDGTVHVNMKQPGFAYLWARGVQTGVQNRQSPDWYENALELLDEPGEWYLDSEAGYLYYMPRAFETLDSAECIIPVMERLVELEGTPDDPIHNLVFDNIEFKYTTWLRPNTNSGHSDAQNNEIREWAYGGYPAGISEQMTDAAVLGINVRYVDFQNCMFDKLGIIGLGIMQVCKDFRVTGCEFYDISGNGINVGESYRPNKNADVIELKYRNKDISFENNYIYDIGVEYFSSTGIGVKYCENLRLLHNEVFNYPYSGMHTGHGVAQETASTSGMLVKGNYFHRGMTELVDGAAFYHFGPTGGIKEINRFEENYVTGMIREGMCFYTDNGTTDFLAAHNVFSNQDTNYKYNDWFAFNYPERLRIFENYMTFDPALRTFGTTRIVSDSNEFENPEYYPNGDWPAEAKTIIDGAGLEAAYLEKTTHNMQWVAFSDLEDKTPVEKMKYGAYVNNALPVPEKSISIGETYQIRPYFKTREDHKYMLDGNESLPGVSCYWTSSDESVVTVDAQGNITGRSFGKATVTLYAIEGELLRKADCMVYVGDTFGEITANHDSIEVYASGDYDNLVLQASSKLGRKMKIDQITYKVIDTSVATCSNNGRIVGVAQGETELVADIISEGKSIEKTYAIRVMPFAPADESVRFANGRKLCDVSLWQESAAQGTVREIDGGVILASSSQLSHSTLFGNEVFEWDMTIESAGGWPSFALRQKDFGKAYDKTDLYMITFNTEGGVDLQRFNNGTRTVIYGTVAGFESVVGPSPSSGVVYGQKARIKAAAITRLDGVRIIVSVNGNTVIDYLDTAEQAITKPGYFTIYARAGSMQFMPVNQ